MIIIEHDKRKIKSKPAITEGDGVHVIIKPTQYSDPKRFPPTRLIGREISEKELSNLKFFPPIFVVDAGNRKIVKNNKICIETAYQIVNHHIKNPNEIKQVAKICDDSWR